MKIHLLQIFFIGKIFYVIKKELIFLRYLKVEIEANEKINESVAQLYSNMMDNFKNELSKGNSVARQTLATLSQQKVKFLFLFF